MATEKWDEVEVDLNLRTVRDVIDERVGQQEVQHLKAKEIKEEVSQCSKIIHARGGELFVWERVTAGVTVRALCKDLGISTFAFYRWIERGGEARRNSLARARADGAHDLVEEALEIADETQHAESNVHVQSAKLRGDRRWQTAQTWNKEAYGQQQAEININLGDIALSALRKRTVRDVVDVEPTDD